MRRRVSRTKEAGGLQRTCCSSSPSFTLGSFPYTSPASFGSTLSAPPLFPASSSPSFSNPVIGIIYNANCTTSLNSSTTTGSASNSTCKVLIVPGFAHTNCTPSHEFYSSPNDSHKKVSTTALDSAPQTSTVPVQYTPAFSLMYIIYVFHHAVWG